MLFPDSLQSFSGDCFSLTVNEHHYQHKNNQFAYNLFSPPEFGCSQHLKEISVCKTSKMASTGRTTNQFVLIGLAIFYCLPFVFISVESLPQLFHTTTTVSSGGGGRTSRRATQLAPSIFSRRDSEQIKIVGSASQPQQLHAVYTARAGIAQTRRSRKLYDDIGPSGQSIGPDEGYPPMPIGIDGSIGSPARFRYPLTPPEVKFRIGVISDLDMDSVDPSDPGKWLSYLREGNLYIQQDKLDPSRTNVSVEWDDSSVHIIKSGLAYSGRGMELSTLNVFNGRLFSCDDRTGVIYELVRDASLQIIPTPWAILADGNYTGTSFKCEWATVKDGDLYVGGHGRDIITPEGKVMKNQKFVKRISAHGEVSHLDWAENFDKMATALNVHFPGFVVHEAAGWSDLLDKWMFMPRYVSSEKFDPKTISHSGSNVVLMADEHFDNVQVGHIGQVIPTHGFSGFKWIPGTNDQLVVALKTLELEGKQQSFIMAFDLRGNVLLPETKISDQKFEGIEFI